MASTTEYSRKILNSPTYAEPCIVNSAKQIMLPTNWYALFSLMRALRLIDCVGCSSPARSMWSTVAD